MFKNAFREICQRTRKSPLRASLSIIIGAGFLGTVVYFDHSQLYQTAKMMKHAAQMTVRPSKAFAQNSGASVFMSGHTPTTEEDLKNLARLYDSLKAKNPDFENTACDIKKIINKQGTDYSILDPTGRKNSEQMLNEFNDRLNQQYIWLAQDYFEEIASKGCPDISVQNMLDALEKAKAPLSKLDTSGHANDEQVRGSIAREVSLGVDRAERQVKEGSLKCDLDKMYMDLIRRGFWQGRLRKESLHVKPETLHH